MTPNTNASDADAPDAAEDDTDDSPMTLRMMLIILNQFIFTLKSTITIAKSSPTPKINKNNTTPNTDAPGDDALNDAAYP